MNGRMTVLVLVLVMATAMPAVSHGQVTVVGENCSVSQDAYGGGICPPPPKGSGDPRLPFTGFEAGIAGGAGLLLVLMGAAIRRATRPQRPPAD